MSCGLCFLYAHGNTGDSTTIVREETDILRPFSPDEGSSASEAERREDLRLADGLAAGDEQAVGELFARYYDRLYRLLYYRLDGDADNAEDALQETLIAALKAIASYRRETRLFSWLVGIAYNKAGDIRRRRSRKAQMRERYRPDLLSMRSNPDDVSARALEDRIALAEQMNRSLLRLSSDYRTALVCKYVEGFTVDEIARLMKRTPASVQSLLFRARQALRDGLEETTEASLDA